MRNSTHMSHQPTRGEHQTWFGFFSSDRQNATRASLNLLHHDLLTFIKWSFSGTKQASFTS